MHRALARRLAALSALCALSAPACGSSDASDERAGGAGAAGTAAGGTAAGGAAASPACLGAVDAVPYLPAAYAPRVGAALRFAASVRRDVDSMRADVLAACRALASGLACPPIADVPAPTDGDVSAACAMAIACVKPAAASAAAPTISGGKCESSVGLAVACETECKGDDACGALCLDAVALSAFCLLPKALSQAAAPLGPTLTAQLPPLASVADKQGDLVAKTTDHGTDAANATLASSADDACVRAARQQLEGAAASAEASRATARAVLTAAGAPLAVAYVRARRRPPRDDRARVPSHDERPLTGSGRHVSSWGAPGAPCRSPESPPTP